MDAKQKYWKGDWPDRTHLMSEAGKNNKKFWPDSKWKHYWKMKQLRCRQRDVVFTLTRDECLELTMQIYPERPSRNGWHLGRLDHSKGYEPGNVEWQWYSANIDERHKRYYGK